VGSEDPVTPLVLSQSCTDALQDHGVDVNKMAVVPGLEHDILLEPVALDALKSLVAVLKKDGQP